MSILTYPSESLILDPGWVDAVEAQRPLAFWRLGEKSNARVAVDQMGTQTPNLIVNSSFELDTAGWTPSLISTLLSVTQTTAQHQFGAGAMQITAQSGVGSFPGAIYGQIARTGQYPQVFKAGQLYTVSAYLKGAVGGEVVQILSYDQESARQTSITPTLTTAWTRYSFTVTPAVDESMTTVYIRFSGATFGTFFVDGVMVTRGSGPPLYSEGNGGYDGDYMGSFNQNLVVDPSFEADTTGAAPNAVWSTTNVSGTGLVAGATATVQTSGGAQVGTKALQVTTPTALFGNGVAQTFPTTTFLANQPYTFSFYAKGNAGGELLIFYLGAASVENVNAQITLTNAWARYSVTWTPTANRVNNGWISIFSRANAVYTFFIDAVQVIPQSSAAPYSDTVGNTVGQPGAISTDSDTSVLFDGQSGYINCGNPTSFQLNVVTLSAWVKTTNTTGNYQGIIAKNSAWGLLLSAGRLSAYNYSTSALIDTGVSISDGKWHHVAVSMQSGVANGTVFYVDGIQVFTGTQTVSNHASAVYIGVTAPTIPGQFFPGSIDEVALFNYILPSHEIADMYAASAYGGRGVDLASGSNGFLLTSIDTPSPPRKRITASSPDTEGNIPVESQYDERTITVTTRSLPAADRSTWYAQIDRLMQKVAKINAEGGVLSRNLIGSEFNYFYDLTDAQADIPWDNVRYALRMDQDITLTFLARPLVRGSEIPLSSHAETTLPSLVFTEPSIRGDVPALGRLVINEDQAGADQKFMVWGLRSRYYDAAATAALFYEAETLTPLDAAVTFVIAGASGAGNNTLRHPALPGNQWCPVLSTDILAGSQKLTHRGSYRVLARVYPSATPQLRLVYGTGDFTGLVTNGPAQAVIGGGFNLVDLGIVRLGNSPQWSGVIQAYAGTQGDTCAVDCLFLVPINEAAGQAVATRNRSPLGINVYKAAATIADDAAVGTRAWSPGQPASTWWVNGDTATGGSPGITHYLKLTGLGFALPSSAVIVGIQLSAQRTGWGPQYDNSIRLYKAGVLAGTAKADGNLWAQGGWESHVYGGPSDLWGTTWLYSDINSATFGVGISANLASYGAGSSANVQIDLLRTIITVYYTTSGGFVDTPDSVMYATRSMQVASNGASRMNSAGTIWVPESAYQGDYLLVPPSGVEGRTTQVIVKASRSDPTIGTDSGIDDISAKLFITPRWLQMPDQ